MAQNNLTLSYQILDNNGDSIARRQISVSDTSPTVGEAQRGYLVDTNEATISLPFTSIRQLLIFNTHATAKITVKWTPNGGAQATVGIVGPGDAIGFWLKSALVTGLGITSLKLTSDTSGATYEITFGG
jgi:hypothetical protein